MDTKKLKRIKRRCLAGRHLVWYRMFMVNDTTPHQRYWDVFVDFGYPLKNYIESEIWGLFST